MFKNFSRIALLILLISTLSACGQKGPLYMPDTDDQDESSAPASS